MAEDNTNINGYLQVSKFISLASERVLNATISQSGTTATASEPIFTDALGALIYWNDTKQVSFVRLPISTTQVTLADSNTRAAQSANLYYGTTQITPEGLYSDIVSGEEIVGNYITAVFDVTAGRDVIAGRDITAGRNATIAENTQTDVLSVIADAGVGNNLNVGALTTTNGLFVITDTEVGGDLIVDGTASANALAVTADADVGGDLTVQGTTTTDILTVDTSATVNGPLNVVGKTTTNDLEVGFVFQFGEAQKGTLLAGLTSVPAGRVTALVSSFSDGDILYVDDSTPTGFNFGCLSTQVNVTNFASYIGPTWSSFSGNNTVTITYVKIGRRISVTFNGYDNFWKTSAGAAFALIGNILPVISLPWISLTSNVNPQAAGHLTAGPAATAYTAYIVIRQAAGIEWALGQTTSPLSPFSAAIWPINAEIPIPYMTISWDI